MRKTKLICSIGPKTEKPEKIKELLKRGVNAFRISAVHYTMEKITELVELIKDIRYELKMPVSIILDLPGCKLRTGDQKEEIIELRQGEKVTVTSEKTFSSRDTISINFSGPFQGVKTGDLILVDDGKIQLRVERISPKKVECVVEIGGILKKNSGVNFPNSDLPVEVPTEEDIKIIAETVNMGLDYYCVSFARNAKDVQKIKKHLESFDSSAKILTKIETKESIETLEDICRVSDGIIVARGDLAVETSLIDLPILQKKIINTASNYKIPVIVATEILNSMINSSSPTRVEIMDVANIVLDGADAILLTSETAVGNFPIETVEKINEIVENVENYLPEINAHFKERRFEKIEDPSEAIARSSYYISEEINAKAIIISTASGSTARRVAYFKPLRPIIATTPDENTFHQLSIVWGIVPMLIPEVHSTDIMIHVAVEKVKAVGYVQNSDIVVVTSGAPCGIVGTTNMLKVHIVE
jgi:pyruvate kinase